MTAPTSTESRALELLGQGLSNTIVASALGVSEGRISQLLSDEQFASKVQELRFQNLQKHNQRDEKYDALEDKLLKNLTNLVDYVVKPMEATRILQVVNAAKRRGSSAPETLQTSQPVVNLTLPQQILNKYEIIINQQNNQVVKAGDQSLVTIQASSLKNLLEQKNGSSEPPRIASSKTHSRATTISAADL